MAKTAKPALVGSRKILEQHKTEYEQVCEHYRQGYRTLFDVARLYLLLQAGLATALGLIVSHPALQIRVNAPHNITINVPIFIIALIGLASGALAVVTLQRYLLYYKSGITRAIELEKLYDMRLMSGIHFQIIRRRTVFTAVNSGHVLFGLIGISWASFLFFSFIL